MTSPRIPLANVVSSVAAIAGPEPRNMSSGRAASMQVSPSLLRLAGSFGQPDLPSRYEGDRSARQGQSPTPVADHGRRRTSTDDDVVSGLGRGRASSVEPAATSRRSDAGAS